MPLVCSSFYLSCWPQSQQVNNSSFKAETLCHISLFKQLLLQTFKLPFLHYIVVFLASCLNISNAIGTEDTEDHLKLLQQFLQISLLWPLWLKCWGMCPHKSIKHGVVLFFSKSHEFLFLNSRSSSLISLLQFSKPFCHP